MTRFVLDSARETQRCYHLPEPAKATQEKKLLRISSTITNRKVANAHECCGDQRHIYDHHSNSKENLTETPQGVGEEETGSALRTVLLSGRHANIPSLFFLLNDFPDLQYLHHSNRTSLRSHLPRCEQFQPVFSHVCGARSLHSYSSMSANASATLFGIRIALAY